MARKTISSNTTTDFGDSGSGSVATKVMQFTASTSPVLTPGATFQIVGRAMGSGAAYKPIPYKRRALAAAASDDTTVSASLTGQDAIIEVNDAGLEVGVVSAGIVAGSMQVDTVDLFG
jgi:hypothetical protein